LETVDVIVFAVMISITSSAQSSTSDLVEAQ